MEEIWKDVVGYEGLYQVSNLGRIKSFDRTFPDKKRGVRKHKGKILTQGRKSNEYPVVTLIGKDGQHKTHRVHRIVAKAFINPVDGKEFIDHINGVRYDNRVENLRWCTHQENDNFPIARKNKSNAKKGNNYFLGKHHTDETKKKIAIARLGTKNPSYWQNLNDENKAKIKKASYEACRVEIDQFLPTGEFVKTWESMTSAANEVGVKRSNISCCCRGLAKTCGGYIWKYHNAI